MTALAFLLPASGAGAHPHVFAEARLDVVISPAQSVQSLRHLWRFDELFSSTVLVEFDKNGDRELDNSELETVAETVKESIAEFGFFQTVTHNGRDIAMAAPEQLVVDFQDQQMIILFESRPVAKLPYNGKLSFGVYDPTFYTAIEYAQDSHMTVEGGSSACVATVVRPDPEEAIAKNQDQLTDAFYNDPSGNDMSKLFATRLEIDCGD